MEWRLLAVTVPLFFVSYQALSKLIPKGTSIFLINAYASLIGLIFMLALHFLFSENKSISLTGKTLALAVGIGVLISMGNFGVIKAFSLGAPQSLFSSLFYTSLIVYAVLVGLLVWHERLNGSQIIGVVLALVGLFMTAFYRKG